MKKKAKKFLAGCLAGLMAVSMYPTMTFAAASSDTEVHEHDYKLVATLKEPTCTTQGIGKQECTICKDSSYIVLPAAHTYGEPEVTKDANCGVDGELTFTCTKCEEGTEGHTKTEKIPASGEHDAKETHVDATCTENGKVVVSCISVSL